MFWRPNFFGLSSAGPIVAYEPPLIPPILNWPDGWREHRARVRSSGDRFQCGGPGATPSVSRRLRT